MDIDIADANLFMMCTRLNANALSELPPGYRIRRIGADELEVWKLMPFDDEETAIKYRDFMSGWFERVYAPREALFFERCLMVCDGDNRPVGSCFFWEAYGILPTIHWFRVKKEYEGRGIGRALLSVVMKAITDYPVFLHTQPGSFRAIKLYSDFGFSFLLDPVIGHRRNDIDSGLAFLREHMPADEYRKLRFGYAPENFLRIVSENAEDEF